MLISACVLMTCQCDLGRGGELERGEGGRVGERAMEGGGAGEWKREGGREGRLRRRE